MMIDPNDITRFDRDDDELEEVLLFWVLAAGKPASRAQTWTEHLVRAADASSLSGPMFLRLARVADLEGVLRQAGTGQYRRLSHLITCLGEDLHRSRLNLRRCTVDELTQYRGIGPKTARAFLLHSRPGQRLAVLDTHLLRHLREHLGVDAPLTTPQNPGRYKELERVLLDHVDTLPGYDDPDDDARYARFDLSTWRAYAQP